MFSWKDVSYINKHIFFWQIHESIVFTLWKKETAAYLTAFSAEHLKIYTISSYPTLIIQFSHSVMSDSLQPHGPQRTRPPCSSPTPGDYSNSSPLSWWCHPTLSSSIIPFSLLPSVFSMIRVFSSESLHIRWPKYWNFSFSISPSNEFLGLISFRMNWLDLLEGTLKSLL